MSEKKGILLESGTNELEIVGFKIGKEYFAINVAKVREIRNLEKFTKVPHQHPTVEGIFKLREKVLPVINLAKFLEIERDETKKGNIIVTEFNNQQFGFIVDYVDRIYRISWEAIEPPSELTIRKDSVVILGIVKMENLLIQLLDFEYIVASINPELGMKEIPKEDVVTHKSRENTKILIAEDSDTLRSLIVKTLEKAGYSNLIINRNGKEAWDKLLQIRDEVVEGKKSLNQSVDLIITDIEMPQMDGLHLTKLVKDDTILKQLPVVIFSSLISDEMRRKCKSVGSDREVTKPEIGQLIGIVDELLGIKHN